MLRFQVGDLPHLNCPACSSGGDLGGELDDGLVIIAVNEVEGAEGLRRLTERAVALLDLAVHHPDGCGLPWRLKPEVAGYAGRRCGVTELRVEGVILLRRGLVPGARNVVDE